MLFSRTSTANNASLPDLAWLLSQTEGRSTTGLSSNSMANSGIPPTPSSPPHAEPQFLWRYDKQGDDHRRSSSKHCKVNSGSPEL
ncbi:hypothetical protein NP233_g11581 [Leucocoprinus birnbaumii]|uniref:Uncharacterized protein n=1 Tax=Leucocoprinus birnbaumii TaxID=56174 RepID=A0AAD5VG60_9AGAR|nr:hypothetical protein NP233_g11581 [Leucocoprinus birnbaumii]